MKKYLTFSAMIVVMILQSCKNEQRTTPDGTMVDRNEGHVQEELDNRGGQSQSSDTTNHNTIEDKTRVVQDSVR